LISRNEQELQTFTTQQKTGFCGFPEAAQKVMKSIAELNDTIDESTKINRYKLAQIIALN
jgi:hypothetical protein